MSALAAGTEIAAVDAEAFGSPLRVAVTSAAGLEEAMAAVGRVLAEIDQACSRFRPDSEISRLNATPDQEVRVSPLLAAALATALRAAVISEGIVDPTIGRALRIAGYDRDFRSVPPAGAAIRVKVEHVAGWRSLRFDPNRQLVRVPRGVEIDLGATAKAMAADLAAAVAAKTAGCGVLVGIGGDIAFAGDPPAAGWAIQAGEDSREPLRAGAETIALQSGAIATSSTTVRRWSRGKVELHHIIDPRTGAPAAGPWRTASVVARTCVDANIGSTTAIVLGADAPAWLQSRALPARLVDRSGSVLRIAGWPEPRGGER